MRALPPRREGTETTTKLSPAILEAALVGGDLSVLTAEQRLQLIEAICQRVGLDPLLRPFIIITNDAGRKVLYATEQCAQQLRQRHQPSINIVGRDYNEELGVYSVTARARLPRRGGALMGWGGDQEDEAVGVVSVEGLKGKVLADALMRAETKAKRRVTLSICGLGTVLEAEEPPDVPSSVVVSPAEAVEGQGTPAVEIPETAQSLLPASPPSAPPTEPQKMLAAYWKRYRALAGKAQGLDLTVEPLAETASLKQIAEAGQRLHDLVVQAEVKLTGHGPGVPTGTLL